MWIPRLVLVRCLLDSTLGFPPSYNCIAATGNASPRMLYNCFTRQVRKTSRCCPRMHTNVFLALQEPLECQWKTTVASKGLPVRPLCLGDSFPLSFVIEPTVRGRVSVRNPHKWENGFCTWHAIQSSQHGRSQHMVVSANPINTDNCGGRAGVGGR